MPSHSFTKHSKYSKDQLFDLVMDIESYPKFLPWCKYARIKSKNDDYIIADLVISFKAFREKYTSKVTFHKNEKFNSINVELIEGPFSYLNNNWQFIDLGILPGNEELIGDNERSLQIVHSLEATTQTSDSRKYNGVTEIKFSIDFKFKSRILEGLIGILFDQATIKMIDAFTKRADDIAEPL